jgi:hypothetical protein
MEEPMNEIERIVDQLKRAYEGPAWHGPSVREVLDGVTVAQAVARPIANAHSIWELAGHIETWERVVRLRIQGHAPEVTDAENFPAPVDPTPIRWQAALDSLDRGHRELRTLVKKLPVERLDDVPVEGGSTVYVLLHGAVQHDLYHAGQIAILRKSFEG